MFCLSIVYWQHLRHEVTHLILHLIQFKNYDHPNWTFTVSSCNNNAWLFHFSDYSKCHGKSTTQHETMKFLSMSIHWKMYTIYRCRVCPVKKKLSKRDDTISNISFISFSFHSQYGSSMETFFQFCPQMDLNSKSTLSNIGHFMWVPSSIISRVQVYVPKNNFLLSLLL